MSKRSRFRRKNIKKNQIQKSKLIPLDPSVKLSSDQIEKLISEKKFSQIIDFFEKTAKQNVLKDEQLSQLAWATYFEKGAEQALEILFKIEQVTPRDLYIEGFCHLDMQNWGEATVTYEKLLEKINEPFVRVLLCEALLKGGKIWDLFWSSSYEKSEEEQAKEKADNETTTARIKEILDVAITQEKCSAQCFLMLEDIWYYENDRQVYEDLRNIDLLKKALLLWNENESIRIQLARRLWSLERKDEAIEILSWAFTAETPSGAILLQAINYLSWSHNYEKAIEYFELAQAKNVFFGETQNLYKAQLLLKAKRFKEVEKTTQAYLEENNFDVTFGAMILNALISNISGDNERSLRLIEQASKLWIDEIEKNESFAYIPGSWFSYSTEKGGEDSYLVEHEEFVITLAKDLVENLTNLDFETSAPIKYLFYRALQNGEDHDIPKSTEIRILEDLLSATSLIKTNKSSILSYLTQAYAENADYISAFQSHVNYGFQSLEENKKFHNYLYIHQYDEEGNELPIENLISKKDATKIHKNAAKFLKTSSQIQKEKVLLPICKGFWKDVLVAHNLHKEIAETTEKLLIFFPDDATLLWLHAYYSNEINYVVPAEKSYRHLLTLEPDNYSALHNLALIVERNGNIQEAIELSDKAALLAPPDDDLVVRVNKNIHERAEKLAQQKIEDEKTKEVDRDSARRKWNELDFYKKKLLHSLLTIKRFNGFSDLANQIGSKENYVKGHWRKLAEQGWIIDQGSSYSCNKFVQEFIEASKEFQYVLQDEIISEGNYVESSISITQQQNSQNPIQTTIVSRGTSTRTKSVFNSGYERHSYQALISIYPNFIIFPNMSLQAIFPYETMQSLLTHDDFNYYLKALVDFCIVSTIDFMPIIAFEIDSGFHDDPKIVVKDQQKNRIFNVADLRLVRVRLNRTASPEEIRNEIIKAVESLTNNQINANGLHIEDTIF